MSSLRADPVELAAFAVELASLAELLIGGPVRSGALAGEAGSPAVEDAHDALCRAWLPVTAGAHDTLRGLAERVGAAAEGYADADRTVAASGLRQSPGAA